MATDNISLWHILDNSCSNKQLLHFDFLEHNSTFIVCVTGNVLHTTFYSHAETGGKARMRE